MLFKPVDMREVSKGYEDEVKKKTDWMKVKDGSVKIFANDKPQAHVVSFKPKKISKKKKEEMESQSVQTFIKRRGFFFN